MATAGQIQFRLKQAKKKMTSLTKDVTSQKKKIKKLESQLKQAKKKKPARKTKPKAKSKGKKKTASRRKKK